MRHIAGFNVSQKRNGEAAPLPPHPTLSPSPIRKDFAIVIHPKIIATIYEKIISRGHMDIFGVVSGRLKNKSCYRKDNWCAQLPIGHNTIQGFKTMPRPYPPPPAVPPSRILPVPLDESSARDLARVLGRPSLSAMASAMVSDAIAIYKTTQAGSPDTTVANTLAALGELTKTGRAYERAVRSFADDRSGVDYTTHAALQSLAKAVLEGDASADAREALARAATKRANELLQHKRVETATEPLRFFCGVLREIFHHAAAPNLKPPNPEAWHHCRQFAMEVFVAGDIDHADFDAHPERLTQYLGTDITV